MKNLIWKKAKLFLFPVNYIRGYLEAVREIGNIARVKIEEKNEIKNKVEAELKGNLRHLLTDFCVISTHHILLCSGA